MSQDYAKPELLAPAGTVASALAAFDAGADAVYAGVQKFNARERGENFTVDTLGRLIAYAHARNRRVYVTLNTLIKQNELPEMAALLAQLALVRPDAVIVQDLGVLRLIRERFPVLPIHASTQMGFHNSAGLRVAQRLGVQRVILERQVTCEEIEAMRCDSPVELEVFVHGALCCSLSGACLFSSWHGGWSGNRGRCKQPCRRRYFSPEGNGFFFSPGDLCGLEDMPALLNLGLTSLKIEGRLRRDDYVRNVVKAYRMVIDVPPSERHGVVKEARAVLSGALGRKWVAPLRKDADFGPVIHHQSPGASGLLCGKVTRASESGFEIAVQRPLRTGDIIRVQPATAEEGPALTLTQLAIGRHAVSRVGRDQRCWVPFDRASDVSVGSYVFKTGEASGADMSMDRLPNARCALDLAVQISRQGLRVTSACGLPEWKGAMAVAEARNRPTEGSRVEAEFHKARSDRLCAGRIDVNIEAGLFVAASELKRARREFWEWADRNADSEALRAYWAAQGKGLDALAGPALSDGPAATYNAVFLSSDKTNPLPDRRAVRPLAACRSADEEALLPPFCPESKLDAVRSALCDASAAGVKRFRVTSLYAFDLLPPGASVVTAFPLPVCNALAAEELRQLGADRVMAWVELEQDAVRALADASPVTVEQYTYGRLPILVTRFVVPARGHMTDARGNGYTVVHEDAVTLLVPDGVFSVPAMAGVPTVVDLRHAELDEPETRPFNFFTELV